MWTLSGCANIWRNVILGSTRPYRIERIGRWSYSSHLVVSCLDSSTARFCTCSTIRIYVEMQHAERNREDAERILYIYGCLDSSFHVRFGSLVSTPRKSQPPAELPPLDILSYFTSIRRKCRSMESSSTRPSLFCAYGSDQIDIRTSRLTHCISLVSSIVRHSTDTSPLTRFASVLIDTIQSE